jgi:hypothetical protein
MRISTNGYVGINTNNPLSPLHIVAYGIANEMNWKKGILLSDWASIYFDGGPNRSMFMGFPSILNDNFYFGSATNLNYNSTVDYSFSIQTNTPLNSNPLNSAHFYKNLLVSEVEAFNVTTVNERRMGINTLNPQNVLEINTASTSAIPGNSGLKFSDLTRFSSAGPNPGQGVLSVDNNGNVIYVQNGLVGPQGPQGIQGPAGEDAFVACNDPNPSAGQLPSDSKINLNDKNFYFKSDNYTLNKNQFLNRFNFFIS